jgi:hypothetical protein
MFLSLHLICISMISNQKNPYYFYIGESFVIACVIYITMSGRPHVRGCFLWVFLHMDEMDLVIWLKSETAQTHALTIDFEDWCVVEISRDESLWHCYVYNKNQGAHAMTLVVIFTYITGVSFTGKCWFFFAHTSVTLFCCFNIFMYITKLFSHVFSDYYGVLEQR